MVVCYDEGGDVKGMAAAGPSNFRNTSVEEASNNIRTAIGTALERSGVLKDDIGIYTFALAGVKDSRRSTDMIGNFVSDLGLKGKIRLLNDGEAGFNCRFPGQDGIIAAPGTGMISYGRRGETFERVSGWGWFLGDEGGALYIARRAMQECTKYFDGRLEINSKLPEMLLRFYDVEVPRDLVNMVYSTPMNIRRIASFSRQVGWAADHGDPMAREILKEAAMGSAQCIIALKRKVFVDQNFSYSGYGGVFRAGKHYWDPLRDTVNSVYPESVWIEPLFGYHAVIGSMFLVMREGGNEQNFDLEEMKRSIDHGVRELTEVEKKEYLLL